MELERSVSLETEMTDDTPNENLPDEMTLFKSELQSLENQDWSRSKLNKKFSEQNLEELFTKYGLRLHRGYFSIFLFVQTSLSVAHVGLLIFTCIENCTYVTVVDILAYLGVEILLWLLTVVIFKQELVKRHNWLPHSVSALAILVMMFVDTVLPIYHTASFHSRSILRPAYSTHVLLSSYIFFPQDNNVTPITLGVTTAVLHIANLYLVTYRNSEDILKQIAADAVFFVCVNILGIYFRYINEIFNKRTFLDKRACVGSTLKLSYEKEREEQLMLSILPRHLVSRVRENLLNKLTSNKNAKRMPNNPCTELYVERHNDVSILYADVVNYTKMTSSLPANRLVVVLNELFGRFDEASEKHKVLRIKFLGDCYYCVSGLPQPNPDHAKNCVDLALEMINIISDVREANDLNIDMRIGIHSGSILCGILGKFKWQYDIWSKDVIIANHMEQSGRSGMVHITKQTLDKLGPKYNVEPGFGHLRDELLAKCNIETFFVIPENKSYAIPPAGLQTSIIWRIPVSEPGKPRSRKTVTREIHNNNNNVQKRGIDVMYSLKRVISGSGHLMLSRRRLDFTDSDAITCQQQLKMADAHMEKAVENLPIGKFNQWFSEEKVRFLCLTFNGKREWEKFFVQQPDPLFKYYLGCALFVFVCICCIQWLIFFGWSIVSCIIYGTSALVLISLLPLTWTHYIWNEIHTTDNSDKILPPKNFVVRMFYDLSLKIILSAFRRTILYFAVCSILAICLLTKMLQAGFKEEDTEMKSGNADSEPVNLFLRSQREGFLGPWQMTEGCSLVIIMSFLFFRIHFQLKLLIASIISSAYIYFIFNYKHIFDKSESWNPDIPPVMAHILSIVFLLIELHLVDRQTEFMSRLDYCWKKQLIKEKNEVGSTRSINKILLQNILPIHVAEIYLDANRSPNELYHEDYEYVSVMFASLTNYSLYSESDTDLEAAESHSLHILNLIVCNFDDGLLTKEFKRIEKIKVAGWSYMAACGLAPGSRNSNSDSTNGDNRFMLIMVRFAAEMMRILKRINEEYSTNFGLRVGISHGPVTAGVVGSQKPHYDIWGNTVNVASRMDSTGESGRIQVPEDSANILMGEGVQCIRRGNIFVKGKGNMDTYYVQLTDDGFLKERNNSTVV